MNDRKIREGERYGNLTVIEDLGVLNGYHRWKCRCDCGRIKEIQAGHLTSGHTKSCGCLNRKYVSRYGNDLTGMVFGKLTVLSKAEPSAGKARWLCRCSCGNTVEVFDSHLKSAHSKSCGCRRSELMKRKATDLTGRTYGRLTVIKSVGKGNWKCRCCCGKEIVTYKENLTQGNTRSCGCLQNETRKNNMEKAIHFVDGTCVERIASHKLFSNNTTGYSGVCSLRNGKYRSYIGFKKKKYSIGTFDRIEDAVAARKQKEEELFGSFLQEYKTELSRREELQGDQ